MLQFVCVTSLRNNVAVCLHDDFNVAVCLRNDFVTLRVMVSR